MSLKFTDTEMFAKIWQRMYTAFGKINICDSTMTAEQDKYKISIIPVKKYDYSNDFVVGEAVYVAPSVDNKKKHCRRGVVVEETIHGWINVMVSDADGYSSVTRVRQDECISRIVRRPEEFEGTWAIKLTHFNELANEIRENEKWRKRIPDAGPNMKDPEAGPNKSKREVVFYPHNVSEMEEVIDYIADVTAN